ncbi:hypothetical protein [Nocardia sp. NBC_00416]|uniref:hypothetical protein n=1 Tax=Nocardia sp. NBC_00416 TaxID=2975991 RepID=UPI002E20C9EC
MNAQGVVTHHVLDFRSAGQLLWLEWIWGAMFSGSWSASSCRLKAARTVGGVYRELPRACVAFGFLDVDVIDRSFLRRPDVLRTPAIGRDALFLCGFAENLAETLLLAYETDCPEQIFERVPHLECRPGKRLGPAQIPSLLMDTSTPAGHILDIDGGEGSETRCRHADHWT